MLDVATATENSYESVLLGVCDVAAEAAQRGPEADAAGVIPVDLFHKLELTGALKALWPTSMGGLGFSFAQLNELIVITTRANSSLGWVFFLGSNSPQVLGLFPSQTVAKFLADFPWLRGRGAIAPKGTAIPVDGGFVVSGQWPFASGGPNPDFVFGNCIISENGAPRMTADGVPDTVLVAFLGDEVQLLDTWHVLGLRGTNSCDFAAREVFVPDDRTTNVFTARNCVDAPVAKLPVRVGLALGHAAVAIGIAQGALDDIVSLAKTKRAAMQPTSVLADDQLFRHQLGEHTLRIACARAMLDQTTESLWDAANSNRRELEPLEILIGRTMAAFVTTECTKIVDSAYTVAGSSSLYDQSTLQRRLRDIHVATQHYAVTTEGYRTLGAGVLGVELSPMDLF